MLYTYRCFDTSAWLSHSATLPPFPALVEQGHGGFAKPRDRGLALIETSIVGVQEPLDVVKPYGRLQNRLDRFFADISCG